MTRPSEVDLQKAMELFEQTTQSLRRSYEGLQDELKELREKLERKGRELDDSLAERDRLAVYLEQLLESVPSGVVAVDPGGRVTTANRAARRIAGFSKGTVGRDFWEVFPAVKRPAEPDPELKKLGGRAARRGMELHRADGERVLVDVAVSPLQGEGGVVLGRVVVFEDVTRLRRLEEQEERNRRLVAMGEMAAGIAHEIRNPLGSLELFASHLADEVRGTAYEDLAEQVVKGIRNLSRITGNLLLYARKIEPARRPVDLPELLRETLVYARAALASKGVELSESLDAVSVPGDPDLLRQVFLNLLMNAVQAVGEGGRLRVTCALDPSETPPVALISIDDDGPGVDEETRERIFDPFFTTRASGVGLGLAIVQRIVSAHGGFVAVETSPLGGARFQVGLPQGGI